MEKIILFFLTVGFIISGCGVPKSPESVDQETSGGYKRTFADEKTSVIIAGAQNNIELPEIGNFKEFIEWTDQSGNIYPMDFGDDTSPMYIKGRNGITYIAIKVLPGKYKLNNFLIRAANSRYYSEIDFKKRYNASFEVKPDEVVFIGILKTFFEGAPAESSNRAEQMKIKAATYLENGKEDLYKITDFYNTITKSQVQTNIMYWNDPKFSKSEIMFLEVVPGKN
ncbi:MAG: DUF4988 domain-containing protein [Endomicrobium sp.]|jgi:hypothetical protein|nr:DUF4988 domain-containing protein [Endomicrobium sp.]